MAPRRMASACSAAASVSAERATPVSRYRPAPASYDLKSSRNPPARAATVSSSSRHGAMTSRPMPSPARTTIRNSRISLPHSNHLSLARRLVRGFDGLDRLEVVVTIRLELAAREHAVDEVPLQEVDAVAGKVHVRARVVEIAARLAERFDANRRIRAQREVATAGVDAQRPERVSGRLRFAFVVAIGVPDCGGAAGERQQQLPGVLAFDDGIQAPQLREHTH